MNIILSKYFYWNRNISYEITKLQQDWYHVYDAYHTAKWFYWNGKISYKILRLQQDWYHLSNVSNVKLINTTSTQYWLTLVITTKKIICFVFSVINLILKYEIKNHTFAFFQYSYSEIHYLEATILLFILRGVMSFDFPISTNF